jgi:hypothetical protein
MRLCVRVRSAAAGDGFTTVSVLYVVLVHLVVCQGGYDYGTYQVLLYVSISISISNVQRIVSGPQHTKHKNTKELFRPA